VARDPDGRLHSHKLLSDNPRRYPDAAIAGIRHILGLANDETIPSVQVEAVKMGTTVATNALLERKGEPTVLAITRGFGDALRIGYQNRPDIFALDVQLPEPLYERVVEIPERMNAAGEVLEPLDEETCRLLFRQLYASGYRSIAIVLLHAYHSPAHERALGRLARECGFGQVSLSSESSPLPRLVSRGDTTVADAYLSPVLRRYVNQVQQELGDIPLLFMQSNGGLCHASAFQGRDSILSGPAGGVVGGIETARVAGFERLIGFDMGGTSTDVWHYAGEYEHETVSEVAGILLRVPMMRIHTVAAGGGSILHYADRRFQVGPDSAGADPGPASYRQGGPLTVTDCNVMLGKLQPDHFPAVFGDAGKEPLDAIAVEHRFQQLAGIIEPLHQHPDLQAIAEGFLTIAIENMAQAIKQISVQRGYDISGYTLCSFGGAGGQHACLVAEALGIKRIYCHPLSGVLSAYGIGLAAVTSIHEAAIGQPLAPAAVGVLQQHYWSLGQSGRQALGKQGANTDSAQLHGRLFLRYQGSDTTLELDYSTDIAGLEKRFHDLHRQQFGFADEVCAIVIESLRVTVSVAQEHHRAIPTRAVVAVDKEMAHVAFYSGGQRHDAVLRPRASLAPGQAQDGPAILTEETATLVIEPGWRATVQADLSLVLTHITPRRQPGNQGKTGGPDPVRLEVFNRRFMGIAEQMGVALARTSHSVNIKERLDFSCALFDSAGNLVANAPHVPVHLGSMSDSVRAVIAKHGADIRPGDAYVLNNPYRGGTHLPDITAVTPVFDKQDEHLLFFVAARGHHADIGGISPGSMPANSHSIEEEGILLDNLRLVRNHRLDSTALRNALESGDWPARNAEQNIADLQAQFAANTRGVHELHALIDEFGEATVLTYLEYVQDNAEQAVRDAIDSLSDGSYRCRMDDGSMISVAIHIDGKLRTATIDFSGTSGQTGNNFNAPASICRAAVLYVFRCMVDKDIPLNEGCMKPLRLNIPPRSVINPEYPAAVVAGNVETSQVIVDCLFGALGVMAASQGTMNNLTFGNGRRQYYETLGGGYGAGRDHDGASGVQCHMTNSRLTDPEILEQRFPVLVECFHIRRQSGGAGRHRGGDGLERCLRFLEPMQVSILSNRRDTHPFGLAGGDDGQRGENWYIDPQGTRHRLAASASMNMPAGGRFLIKTPGGGGFGKPA
jgi:5-oxoprolinase (ATP-hydrolysing)